MTSESSIISSCPCHPCTAKGSPFQQHAKSDLSSSSCPCNPCMDGQTPQPSTKSSNSCSCNPYPPTLQPSRYSSASSCLEASQQSIATGPDSSCSCVDTGSATTTPLSSLCTCNPCMANGIYSAESNMLEKISLFSLQSADLHYMNKLHELAIKENRKRVSMFPI